MADDLGPSSSYSDPFYDRLDAFATLFKRMWPLFLLALALIIAAIFTVSWVLQRHPDAGSAARFVAVRDESDEAKRTSGWQTLLDDTSVTEAFRARAAMELTQLKLSAGDTAGAGPIAAKAVEFAATSGDAEVQLAAKISRAAVHLQANELDQAAAAYAEAKRASGAKYPMPLIEATLGLARTLRQQGKLADAATELEPLTVRSDQGATALLNLAKVLYWDCKRQAEAPTPAAPAPEASVAPTAPAPAAPTPAAGQ